MGSILDPTTLTIVRRPGVWTAGRWVPSESPPDPFTVIGSQPQPVGPEVIEMLPEAARATARFIIFVEDDQPDLIMIDDTGVNASDHVQYSGKEYLLAAIENWTDRALGHNAYALIQVAADE